MLPVRITPRYDARVRRGALRRSKPIVHNSLLYGWREASSSDGSDDDEANDFWIKVIRQDYERAKSMNLPEPTWLPEKTLAEYARVMGLKRDVRPVDPDHIRIRIKRMRWVRRMTQAELGERVGLSQAAISYIERGSRYIRLTQLTALAEALDVKVEWLVRPPEGTG